MLDHRACGLYEDSRFLKDHLNLSGELGNRTIYWMRPNDLDKSPKFLSENVKSPVEGGIVTNENLINALYLLRSTNRLPVRACMGEDSFFHGRFETRFWKDGDAVVSEIDDMLPFYREDGIFMPLLTRSTDSSEFWASLVEKAYVKFLGSYSALRYKTLNAIMRDMTGAVTELLDLSTDDGREMSRQCLARIDTSQSSVIAGKILDNGMNAQFSVQRSEDTGDSGIYFNLSPLGTGYSIEEANRAISSSESSIQAKLTLDQLCGCFSTISIAWMPHDTSFPRVGRVKGSWSFETAGGPFGQEYFSRNPQLLFKIRPEQQVTLEDHVVFEFRVEEPANYPVTIALYKLPESKTQTRRASAAQINWTMPDQMVHSDHGAAVLYLTNMSAGQNYILMPALTEVGCEGSFCVRILSTLDMVDITETQ